MPVIQTRQFGPLDYSAASVFHFPSGVPGFENMREFVFLELPDARPLLFMHSLHPPDLCFILLPILVVEPQYRLHLSPEDLAELRLPAGRQPRIGEDIACAAVICSGDEADGEPTANLLAPVVLNLKDRIGIQVIQSESGYSHRHPVLVRDEVPVCS